MRRLLVFDTTLRDGDQTAGVAFDKKLKPELAVMLANIGVDVIEAGFPLASCDDFDACVSVIDVLSDFPVEVSLICRCDVDSIKRTAGMFRKCGLLHVTLPVSDLHISSFFGVSRLELLRRGVEMVSYASGLVSLVEVGAEDATRAEPEFLVDYCNMMIDAGAKVVNIADTVGLFVPDQMGRLIEMLFKRVDKFAANEAVLSVHCHNDGGLAVANTLAAVLSGCGQVEVTVGGIGERAGNASLEEVAANLGVHSDIYGVKTNIKCERLAWLANQFYSAAGFSAGSMKPLTGWNIRAHASGIHQRGVAGSELGYLSDVVRFAGVCEVLPERIVLSRHSGKAGILLVARSLGLDKIDDADAERMLVCIKDSGERSFGVTEFLLLAEELGLLPPDVGKVVACKNYSEQSTTTNCKIKTKTKTNYKIKTKIKASVKIKVKISDDRTILGKGDSYESALLSVAFQIAGYEIKINKTELTAFNNRYRIYAELTTTHTKKIIALERSGNHPNKLLFECLLDTINTLNCLTKDKTSVT
ncbi:MAG: hypothetical protein LBQ66_13990 [Planctomycetaceae bacterium]|nr:hypothetical protein [Planctomycetaceae bacterium]